MARQRRHTPRRRRRGRFRLLYKAVSMLAVAAAVIIACVVFFRINEVSVAGNTHYTAQEIIEASGIQTGDNLIALSKSRVASAIRSKLPYVEAVSIQRLLPDGVLLTVTERVAAASLDTDEGRWLISSGGRLLEQGGSEGVVQIVGLTARSPYAGEAIQVAEEDQATLEYVIQILTALEDRGMLAQCTQLDCSETASIWATWGIYQLKFPRGGDYQKMLYMLETVMGGEEIPQGEAGTFDFSVAEGELYFRRST